MVAIIISGPHEPKIPNSFIYLLTAEFNTLSRGILAIDGQTKQQFTLCACIAKSVSDQKAMNKILQIKGAGSKKGCHLCEIQGVRYGTIYYYIYCTHDDLEEEDQRDENAYVVTGNYNFERPLLRRNVQRQIVEITRSDNAELRKQTGINGLSKLIRISSLKFNAANLYDTMHACLLNCTKYKVR